MIRTGLVLLTWGMVWAAAGPSVPPGVPPTTLEWPEGSLTLSDAVTRWNRTENAVVDLRSELGQPAPDVAISPPPKPVTFWSSLVHAAGQARLQFAPRYDAQKRRCELVLTERSDAAPPPTSIDGPFLGVFDRTSAVRSFADPSVSHLGVGIRLLWEPRLRPVLARFVAGDATATTAAGLVLTADGLAGVRRLAGESHLDLNLRFPPPTERTPLRQVLLQGDVMVSPGDAVLSFKAADRRALAADHGVSAELVRTSHDPFAKVWHAEIRAKYAMRALDLESHQTWALESAGLNLDHPDGTTLLGKLMDVRIEENRGVLLAFALRGLSKAPDATSTLRLTLPAPPVRHRLNLRFDNVPLP